ncbi:ATP-binding protein [Parasediminibacterium sp. JCM 36343]|uniref:hybrid sensor histidine kinase/response regulator n=1 Tax=Parasediminibacterium sp. JCM 36343 TaxID=3374279 RepID=UPI00397824F3
MAALPKSKLSASNIVLLVVCLMVIIAVLLLNIFNTKNLAQIRTYINSLSNDNSSVAVLRSTSTELLEAENAYRLYLSTKDTLYSNKYLSHIVACVSDLRSLQTGSDTAGVATIIAGIEQKIQISDGIDLLKRISDSISVSKIHLGNNGFYINPYWYRMSNNSLLKGYDSLMQQTDATQTNGSRKKAFLKKLGDIFANKEETAPAAATNTTTYTRENKYDQSQQDIDDFYKGQFNEFLLKTKMDENEKALAEVNLVIQYQVSDALKKLLGIEQESGKQKEDKVLEMARGAKETVKFLSWGSYIIIICVVIVLIFNVRKSLLYEKEIIEAREAAEKLVMTKSRFLSNMSHEIRSPLTSIIGFTEQLDNVETDPDKKRYLNAIRTSSDHLLTTVNDILDFSKLDAGKLSLSSQPFNIKKVVDEVLYAFSVSAEKKGIQMQSDIQLDDDLLVTGDAFRLKQILFNLTSNAIKFTEHGKVKIMVKSLSRTERDIVVKIDVQDSGVGIPEDQLEFIFQEFAQASNTKSGGRRAIRGTGLGLAICKMLVELQGGKIGVKSELNIGSVFSITMPYSTEPVKRQAPEIEESANLAQTFAGKKALVVEDNEMNILLLKLLLKKMQIGFDVAKDGEEGMKLFENNYYDIVLTDINIPKLTGDQLAGLIRKSHDTRKARIPIVALTASIIGDNTEQYFRMGINELLIKPFKEADFKAVLQQYLFNNV